MSISPSVEPSIPTAAPPPTPATRQSWPRARIAALVIGCIVGLTSLGFLSAGGWATWETSTQRDAGYITSDRHIVTTAGSAITTDEVGELGDRIWGGLLGNVRIRATSTNPGGAVFIGVAPKASVDRYLAGADREVITEWFPVKTHAVVGSGATPQTAPSDADIWSAKVAGPGAQALVWKPKGDWTVVVMNANGSSRVSVNADFGAQVPNLKWLAVAFFAIGAALAIVAIALILVPVRRARKGA